MIRDVDCKKYSKPFVEAILGNITSLLKFFAYFLFFVIILFIEVSILTNINCSSNCIYQKDGKCSYEFVSTTNLSSNSFCAYYVENNKSQSH